MDLRMGQLVTMNKVSKTPITDDVINTVEKWRRIRGLSHKHFIIIKKKKLVSLLLIWQEWTNNNKLNKQNKTNMSKFNTITITQNIFMMRILIGMRRVIRNNWVGYYKILKETKNPIRRKIKRIMNMQKKKMTLRI